MSSTHIVYTLIILLTLYAFIYEMKEQHHAYMLAKPVKEDTIKRSLRKLKTCVKYQFSMVIWRRTLISVLLIILLVFSLVQRRIPTAKELLMYTILGFTVLTLNSIDYQKRSLQNVVKYATINMENIEKYIQGTKPALPSLEI